MADLYPGAPSHNVPISTALLWACSNVDGVRALRRRSFAYALSTAVLVSLFMDVDFLASDLKVPATHTWTYCTCAVRFLHFFHGSLDVYACISKWTGRSKKDIAAGKYIYFCCCLREVRGRQVQRPWVRSCDGKRVAASCVNMLGPSLSHYVCTRRMFRPTRSNNRYHLCLLESCAFGLSVQAFALSQLEEEDDDLPRVIVERNMHTFGRIVVGIAAGLKALSWQGLLATFPQVLNIPGAFVSHFDILNHSSRGLQFYKPTSLSA